MSACERQQRYQIRQILQDIERATPPRVAARLADARAAALARKGADPARGRSGRWGQWARATLSMAQFGVIGALIFVACNNLESFQRADSVEPEIAMLSDPVPPAAYADPAFARYLSAYADAARD